MNATWTATPAQMSALLDPVLVHAASDRHLPMICCVSIEVSADRVLAAATNRYSLGIAWHDFADELRPDDGQDWGGARVYASDLKRVLSFLRPHRSVEATWVLTDERLTVTAGLESLSVRTVDVEFVHWRKFLGERAAQTAGQVDALAFNPRFSELFNKSADIIGDNAPVIWRLGATANDAPLVQIGERFLGMLMPVRLPEQTALDLTPLSLDVPKAVAA